MNWQKKTLNWTIIRLALGALIIPVVPNLAGAESLPSFTTALQKFPSWKISQNFHPPNRGRPDITAGGGTRSACSKESKKILTPLLPKTKLGLTFSDRPTFYWFVPAVSAKIAEFTIQDKDGNPVYDNSFDLPDQSGIVAFTPSTSLEVGKQYHWFLTIACDAEQTTEDQQIVEGWIERTQITDDILKELGLKTATPEILKSLEIKYPQKLAQIYTKAGIWHEAISNLVSQRCTAPEDPIVLGNWQALLESKSVGLKDVELEPLLNSCNKTN
jgi:hypothetical protein